MEIEKVEAKDLKELQDIGRQSYLPHYTHLWNPGGVEWYLERCFSDAVLQQELNDANVEYYTVAVVAQLVGFAKFVLHKPLPDSNIDNAFYLEKIYFVKEHTGKSYGRQMIELALTRAKELKRECVWLMAMDTSTKPIAAYQKAGFSIHSHTRLDFELMKLEFRGMVVMKKMI